MLDETKFDGFFLLVDTTRPQRVLEESGQSYWFTDRETMEEDVKKHKFLEYGEYNGHLYGTHLDTIRDVIKQVNFMCEKKNQFKTTIFLLTGKNVRSGLQSCCFEDAP